MRIRNSDITAKIYFIAVDLVDLTTRITTLTNAAVWYSFNGGSKVDMSTPTIAHINNGVFSLLIDESGMTTFPGSRDEVELFVEISADEMATVARVILIYRTKITLGETLTVNGSGHVSRVTLVDTTTTNTDMAAATGQPTLS